MQVTGIMTRTWSTNVPNDVKVALFVDNLRFKMLMLTLHTTHCQRGVDNKAAQHSIALQYIQRSVDREYW